MKPMEIYVGQIMVKYKKHGDKLSREEYLQIKDLIGAGMLSGVIGKNGWWIICKEYRTNEYVIL